MIIKFFNRLRKRPREERDRFVSLAAIIVMLVVTIMWLPFFFLRLTDQLFPTQSDASEPIDASLRAPYSE